jgi:hypothetical protein
VGINPKGGLFFMENGKPGLLEKPPEGKYAWIRSSEQLIFVGKNARRVDFLLEAVLNKK